MGLVGEDEEVGDDVLVAGEGVGGDVVGELCGGVRGGCGGGLYGHVD